MDTFESLISVWLEFSKQIIHLRQAEGVAVSVVEQAESYLQEGNGTVCLTIERCHGGKVTIGVEPYESKSFWEEVLVG